jgi:hypothetical protein
MLFDLVVALGFTVAAVVMHRSHIDGVDANSTSDLFSTLLTVIAIAPLAVRRAQPLGVLVVCAVGLVGLMAGQYVVALAPVGVLIAFYSVVAWGTPRAVRLALGVVAAVLAATAVVRPVDLSLEGIAVNGALLAAGVGARYRGARAAGPARGTGGGSAARAGPGTGAR